MCLESLTQTEQSKLAHNFETTQDIESTLQQRFQHYAPAGLDASGTVSRFKAMLEHWKNQGQSLA